MEGRDGGPMELLSAPGGTVLSNIDNTFDNKTAGFSPVQMCLSGVGNYRNGPNGPNGR